MSLAATAADATELKLADFQPPSHFVVDKVSTPFAEAVSAATGGEVSVEVFMGGELGPGPAEQYYRVVDGVADIAFSLPGYNASNLPLTLLTELPGVIDAETGTEGKEVITLSGKEAAKFNAASAEAVAQVLAEAEAEGLPAQAFVDALKAN